MRRASTCLALLGLAVLSLTGVASAAPTVTLVAKAVPIPGFPGTGNILGAGAAVEAKYTIHGTESTGGVPSQITHVNFFLPAGTKINQAGFVTCPSATLENIGPSGCPKKSQASPIGTAGVVDPIGGELRQRERDAAGVLCAGRRSAVLRQRGLADLGPMLVAKGHFVSAAPPYGLEFTTEVRWSSRFPGRRRVDRNDQHQGRRRVQEGQEDDLLRHRCRRKCPKGGFPIKSEVMFAATGEASSRDGDREYKAPCPKIVRRQTDQRRGVSSTEGSGRGGPVESAGSP